MKRIVSIFILIMFMFSMNVFADDYDLLAANYDNYSANINVTMSVSEPMTVLKLLGEAWGISDYIDLQQLGESLCDSKLSGVIKYSANAELTKIKASYEMYSVLPLKVNNNLKSTNELNFGMWFEWDLTDENNPKMNYIYSMPVSTKYVVMDLSELLKNGGVSVPEYVSMMKNYLNREHIEKLNSGFVDILRNNSAIKSTGTKSVITVTRDELVQIICDTCELISKDIEDNKQFDELISNDYYNSFELPDAKEVKKFFKNADIFDGDALVIEINKTGGGSLKSISCKLNMCINNQLIAKALESENTDGLSDIKFSVNIDTVYTAINNGVNVKFPELNEENSIPFSRFSDLYGYDLDYDWDGENCWHDEYVYTEGEYIEAAPDTFYVNINSFTDSAARYGYDYKIENNNGAVTITDNNKKENFNTVSMTVGSPAITVDSMQYTALNPVLAKGGDVYADTEAVKYIFNADMGYFNASVLNNTTDIEFDRRSPQCHHTDEEINSWYDDGDDGDYCAHTEYVYIDSDSTVNYVPLANSCREFYGYDNEKFSLVFDNGTVTLTDLSGKEKFKTVVFTVGSDEYTVDGNVLKMQQPAIEKDVVVYVDINTLAELFGAKINDIRLYYIRGYMGDDGKYVKGSLNYSYDLRRKSPDCIHTDEEIEADEGQKPWLSSYPRG